MNAIMMAMGACLLLGACASTGTGEDGRPLPVVVRDDSQMRIDTGGIPPDKQADVYLVLQQRDASARKCYQDVLNEKHTRQFNGTARAVRVTGGTLNNKDVENCLVETIKDFEFPKLDRGGDIQYDYTFEPQY
jgi:hypothetical protein